MSVPIGPRTRPKPSPSLLRVTIGVLSGISLLIASIPYGFIHFFATDCTWLHEAQGDANSLGVAVAAYQNDYGHLPPASTNPIDTSTQEGAAFITILLGQEGGAATSANPKQIPYLAVKEGKARKNGLNYGRDGKLTGLFDHHGHPYRVFLDTAGKGSITLPSGRTITGAVVAVCDGEDGIPDNWDDIISGQPLRRPGFFEKLWRNWFP